MEGCLNMWSISSVDPMFAEIPMDTPGLPNNLPSINSEQSYDKYLFISKSFKTMVINTHKKNFFLGKMPYLSY